MLSRKVSKNDYDLRSDTIKFLWAITNDFRNFSITKARSVQRRRMRERERERNFTIGERAELHYGAAFFNDAVNPRSMTKSGESYSRQLFDVITTWANLRNPIQLLAFSVTTLVALPSGFLSPEGVASVTVRGHTKRTLCNCTPARQVDLPVPLPQLFHWAMLRTGVWTTPGITLCSLSLPLVSLGVHCSCRLLHGAHRRPSTHRSRLGGLYEVRVNRGGKREAKQTNIQKGATPALLNKTKRRAAAKFS